LPATRESLPEEANQLAFPGRGQRKCGHQPPPSRGPCPSPFALCPAPILSLANTYLTLTLVTGDGFNQCHVPATSTRLKSSPWPFSPTFRPSFSFGPRKSEMDGRGRENEGNS